MERKTQRKIFIGKNAKHTHWGLMGCSHGSNWGGYNNYLYGIKGLFVLQVYVGWGECSNSKI